MGGGWGGGGGCLWSALPPNLDSRGLDLVDETGSSRDEIRDLGKIWSSFCLFPRPTRALCAPLDSHPAKDISNDGKRSEAAVAVHSGLSGIPLSINY